MHFSRHINLILNYLILILKYHTFLCVSASFTQILLSTCEESFKMTHLSGDATLQLTLSQAEGNPVKTLGEIQEDTVHFSPHISQESYFVIADDHICKEIFVLVESVLHFPNQLLHLIWDGPRRTHSITFPGAEDWCVYNFLDPPLSLFIDGMRNGMISAVFQSSEMFPDLLKGLESSPMRMSVSSFNNLGWTLSGPINVSGSSSCNNSSHSNFSFTDREFVFANEWTMEIWEACMWSRTLFQGPGFAWASEVGWQIIFYVHF